MLEHIKVPSHNLGVSVRHAHVSQTNAFMFTSVVQLESDRETIFFFPSSVNVVSVSAPDGCPGAGLCPLPCVMSHGGRLLPRTQRTTV